MTLEKSIKNSEKHQVALNWWSHCWRIEKLFADAAVQTLPTCFACCVYSTLRCVVLPDHPWRFIHCLHGNRFGRYCAWHCWTGLAQSSPGCCQRSWETWEAAVLRCLAWFNIRPGCIVTGMGTGDTKLANGMCGSVCNGWAAFPWDAGSKAKRVLVARSCFSQLAKVPANFPRNSAASISHLWWHDDRPAGAAEVLVQKTTAIFYIEFVRYNNWLGDFSDYWARWRTHWHAERSPSRNARTSPRTVRFAAHAAALYDTGIQGILVVGFWQWQVLVLWEQVTRQRHHSIVAFNHHWRNFWRSPTELLCATLCSTATRTPSVAISLGILSHLALNSLNCLQKTKWPNQHSKLPASPRDHLDWIKLNQSFRFCIVQTEVLLSLFSISKSFACIDQWLDLNSWQPILE